MDMDVEQSHVEAGAASTGEVQAFLIADIRGYSTFTSQHGAAAAAHLATTFTDLSRDAVAARGGKVLGLRGDEMLAAFSTAGQAVRAAVDLQFACAEATAVEPDFPLGVGAGVDVGEAVAADQHHGAAINMAARLCAHAAAGQVLVTTAVADAARYDLDLAFAAGPTVALKGFEQPVEILEARSVRAVDRPTAIRSQVDIVESPPPLPLELDEATPMVGRDGDQSWLRGMWRQARRGQGRVVFVTGPAGIGKTRLAAELAHQVLAGGSAVYYCGGGGTGQAETLAAITAAQTARSPGLWVLDQLNLYPPAAEALLQAAEGIESRPALVMGLFRDASGDPTLSTLVDRLNRHGDSLRQLEPLDLDGVVEIALGYVADADDLPAESILRGSGGVPATIHELVTQWASTEAARQLTAAAEWLAEGRSRQAAGLRFADNVIAAHLGRIYDASRPEDHAAACPYKGLGAFEESDAAYFFGREQLVGELAAKTVGFGFLGVVGPSGSGKSSVVLAGLIPSLRAGLLPGSERWNHTVLRPGQRPLAALDGALAGAGGTERQVLVVDQFEEVFSTGDAAERDAFINRLVALANDANVLVVVAIRADFTGHCALYPDLADLLAANLVLVGPMTADELRRVIEAPARKVGVRVENRLVDALVEEVGGEPGGLPLLSTALVELWQARDNNWLRFDAYLHLGGVHTAVARLAESSYKQLDPAQREAARTIFVRMVDAGEGESAVRRQVSVSEFDLQQDPVAAEVLSVLTRDRLLTRDDEQVEIAHEALAREWPRLRRWLEEDTAGRQLRSRITQSARQWAERGRDPADLYQGARLSAALDWWQTGDRSLNAVERHFLTESREASQRHLERQRRINRRLRSLLVGTVVFLAVALTAGLFALVQRNHARSAQKAAEAQALQSDAERVGTLAQTESNLDLSLLLAVAGVKLEDRSETRSDLLAALQRTPSAFRFIRPSSSEVTAIAITPDGKLMATGDAAGAVRFENLTSWTQSGPLIQLSAPVPPIGLAISPDGQTVAVAAGEGDTSQVFLIDVRTRHTRLIGTWPGVVPPIPNGSTTLAFSADGAKLAVGLSSWSLSADEPVSEQVVLLDTSNGNVIWQRPYRVLKAQMEAQVAFTRAGTLVTSAEGGTTDLWDADTGKVVRQFPIGGRFALSPDGRQVAIGVNSSGANAETETVIRLLDLTTGSQHTLQSVPDSTWIATLQYTPDGKSVLGGSLDGDVREWNVASGAITQTYMSQSGGRTQIAVAPSGRTVVSGSDDGSVVAWDLSGRQTLGRTFAWSTPDNSCSATPCFTVNPAGTVMATDEFDGTIDLVDLRTLTWYATLPGTKGLPAIGLAFTRSGQLMTGDTGGNIVFWDTQSAHALRKLHVTDPVYNLAVSPDGQQLAVQTQADNASTAKVHVVDLATGLTLRSYQVSDGAAGLAYSPDGKDLVALGCCSPGSTVDIWDASSGAPLVSPKISGQLQSIAFSPVSPVLGIGTADGKIYQWDTSRSVQVGNPVRVAASNVVQIAYSADGKLLAASLRDGTTRLVDVAPDQMLGNSFPVQSGVFTAPLFTAKGDLLINYVGSATDWPTSLDAWERYACQVAGRDLTPTEWENVLPNRPYQHVCSP
jgi:WD40 repeat protein/class 3 adenylate cyclase